ncbi:Hap1 protein [Martiniozyma asiatica (nom. inval.)]|nr:Hap1 protein [Martiniozyma asiatica]
MVGDTTVPMPPKKTRKRNRVPISCIICRRRKVKCDKTKPTCINCVKNGVADKCHYIEPSWAKEPNDMSTANTPQQKHEDLDQLIVTPTLSTTLSGSSVLSNSVDHASELKLLQEKMKELENENNNLRRKIGEYKGKSSQRMIRNQDTAGLMDCIFNSNILFIAKKGRNYNFTITYQISSFSWMFFVRNDFYLNDLWLKILKLRQHYEYYHSSKNSMLEKSSSNQFKYYNYKLSRLRGQESVSVTSKEKTSEHNSKLKRFLEGTLHLPRQTSEPVKSESPSYISSQLNISSQRCPVLHTSKSMPVQSQSHTNNVCPATGNNEPVSFRASQSLQSESTISAQSSQQNTPNDKYSSLNKNVVFTKCPVLHPNDSSLAFIEKSNSNLEKEVSPNGMIFDEYHNNISEDILTDNKVCPLMVGDAKALFKEKLSKMNLSAVRDTYSKSPLARTPEISETPKSVSDLKTEKYVPIAIKPDSRSSSIKRSHPDIGNTRDKRIKLISPSAIKNLNYNNTKQIISVIEQNLPSRKVVWLLIDRFFEKLYIQMPYVDEQNFRLRLASIINNGEMGSQRISLSSIGTKYCEEFLTICLMLIIIRLSWLSLPKDTTEDLSQTETLLLKPENFVTLVLIDLVKEVFSSAKLMSKPSLIIFQVGLFLKVCNTLSPEDGFDMDDSYTNNNTATSSKPYPANNASTMPITNSHNFNNLSGDLANESPNMNSPNFTSMLIQLAYTIGLNRDPLNFKNFYPSSANDDPANNARLFRKRHLWRKLWYGLVCISMEVNLSLGDYKKSIPIEFEFDPSLGNDMNKSWDCRVPGGIEQGVLERSYDNGKALQRELCVVQLFRECMGVYRWIYKGMKLLEAVDKPPETKDLQEVSNKLSDFLSEKSKHGFGMDLILSQAEIGNPFSGRNSAVWVKKYTIQIKLFRLKVHLLAKNMMFALNYLMLLNHEQKLSQLVSDKRTNTDKIEKQSSYIESFFETTLLLALDNFKMFTQLSDSMDSYFQNNCGELFICPYLLILNHRSHEFLISLILRLQQSSPVVMEILKKNNIEMEELTHRLFSYLDTFINKLDGLTKRYYYAWGLKKLVKLFYNILSNSQKFFNLNFKKLNVKKEEPLEQEIVEKTKDKSRPLSAFEIAFGTSKLPPVTDFNQNIPKEIPHSLPEHSYEPKSQNMMGHNRFSKISESNSAGLPSSPTFNTQYAHTPSDSDRGSVGSGINTAMNGIFNALGSEINELFDDNFLNDIGGFNMENFDGSMNNIATENNNLQVIPDGFNPDHRIVDSIYTEINNRQAPDFATPMAGNFEPTLAHLNAGSRRNEIYNSLNEIDFTNVDLTAGIDINEMEQGNTNGFNNLGLGWDFFQ